MVRTLTCTAKLPGADGAMELRVNLPAKWESKPLRAVVKLLSGHVATRRGERGGYAASDVLVLSVKNANGTFEALDVDKCVSTLFTRDEVVLEVKKPPVPEAAPAAAAPAAAAPVAARSGGGVRAVAPSLGKCCHGKCDCGRFAPRKQKRGLAWDDEGGDATCAGCGYHALLHVPQYGDAPRRVRWVLLKPKQGLCNRLRALCGALFLCDDVERALGYAEFEVKIALDWEPDVACGCRFSDLFKAHPRIVEVGSVTDGASLDDVLASCADPALRCCRALDVVTAIAKREKTKTVSLTAERFSAACASARIVKDVDALGAALKLKTRASRTSLTEAFRFDVLRIETSEFFYPVGAKDCNPGDGGPCLSVDDLLATRSPPNNPREDADTIDAFRSAYLRQLSPVDAVAARLPDLGDRPALAVHVRRTDNAASIIHSPPALFQSHVAEKLGCGKNAPKTIYLATDDPAVEGQLAADWKARGIAVVTTEKRTLVDGFANRQDVEGVQDALVDLLSLACCDAILGSFWSSFSRLAALWRNLKLEVALQKTELAGADDLEAAALGIGGLNRAGRAPEDMAASRRLVHTIFPSTKAPKDPGDDDDDE